MRLSRALRVLVLLGLVGALAAGPVRAELVERRSVDALLGAVATLDFPEGLRSQAGAVATGDGRVVVWGGRAVGADSGLLLDLSGEAASWEQLPPAPGPSRSGAATAWTGTEAVFWGGATGASSSAFEVDPGGVAYDPAARTWRSLPSAPLGLHASRAAAVAGGLLVTGGRPAEGGVPARSFWLADGAEAWVDVPTTFFAHTLAVSGDEVLAAGPVDGDHGRWAVQAFDPVSLTWSPAADALVTEWAAVVRAADGAVTAVTLDGLNEPLRGWRWSGSAWQLRAESRRAAEGVVIVSPEDYPPVAVAVGDLLHVGGEGSITRWDASAERFAVRGDPAIRSFGGPSVWTGEALVAPVSQNSGGWSFTP